MVSCPSADGKGAIKFYSYYDNKMVDLLVDLKLSDTLIGEQIELIEHSSDYASFIFTSVRGNMRYIHQLTVVAFDQGKRYYVKSISQVNQFPLSVSPSINLQYYGWLYFFYSNSTGSYNNFALVCQPKGQYFSTASQRCGAPPEG